MIISCEKIHLITRVILYSFWLVHVLRAIFLTFNLIKFTVEGIITMSFANLKCNIFALHFKAVILEFRRLAL